MMMHMNKEEEGKGLPSSEDGRDASLHGIKYYIKENKGRLITATRNSQGNLKINWILRSRKEKWKEKQLYGYFKKQTNEILYKQNFTCLRTENFRRVTESLPVAEQNINIKTTNAKAKTDKEKL